jgi:septum formation protein
MRLILASASPRRADLLRAAGIPFESLPVHIDERFESGEQADRAVVRLAEAKAAAAAALRPGALVLGADTIVVVHGEALGKPVDNEDARRMLSLLSGRTHEVFTGICLRYNARKLLHVEPSRVRVANLTSQEIDWYVGTGEPLDKAGAYAIQGLGSRFIERIDGSYSNVVGLPISSVYALIKEVGCDILSN